MLRYCFLCVRGKASYPVSIRWARLLYLYFARRTGIVFIHKVRNLNTCLSEFFALLSAAFLAKTIARVSNKGYADKNKLCCAWKLYFVFIVLSLLCSARRNITHFLKTPSGVYFVQFYQPPTHLWDTFLPHVHTYMVRCDF